MPKIRSKISTYIFSVFLGGINIASYLNVKIFLNIKLFKGKVSIF